MKMSFSAGILALLYLALGPAIALFHGAPHGFLDVTAAVFLGYLSIPCAAYLLNAAAREQEES